MEKQFFLTKDGLEKVKTELDELRGVKRKEIAQRIQDAKELGDLSENAEYAEAKNEQSFTEGRIAELEAVVKNAVLIDESKKNSHTVEIGSTICIRNGQSDINYNIVGSNEADPSQGRISNESPLGKALLKKKIGDIVTLETPKGAQTLEIVSIS